MTSAEAPPVPGITLSRSHNTSSSSTTTTLSSALSLTCDVAGFVPLVGPQLQSVCELALKLVNGLQGLKDMQDDERRLMEKVQDTLRIVSEARGDDRAIPMPELRDELRRVESSLLSIEIYLDARMKRTFRQRITTLITQRDTRNATQCNDRLDSALQRFQLVCLIKMRLELDAKMTELKHDVVGSIKSLGDTIMGFLHPPPYTAQAERNLKATRRSVTPFHAGRVRSRDVSEDREDPNPSKKVRTSRRGSREAESRRESDDSLPNYPLRKGDAFADSRYNLEPRSPEPGHSDSPINGKDTLPLPQKRRRSSGNRHQTRQHDRLGIIDENAAKTLDVDNRRPSNASTAPLMVQNLYVESEYQVCGTGDDVSAPEKQPRTLKRKQDMYFRT